MPLHNLKNLCINSQITVLYLSKVIGHFTWFSKFLSTVRLETMKERRCFSVRCRTLYCLPLNRSLQLHNPALWYKSRSASSKHNLWNRLLTLLGPFSEAIGYSSCVKLMASTELTKLISCAHRRTLIVSYSLRAWSLNRTLSVYYDLEWTMVRLVSCCKGNSCLALQCKDL